MTPDEQLSAWTEQFEEDITKLGFRKTGQAWRGAVPAAMGPVHVDLDLRAPFPLKPPRVVPVDLDALPWSWHRELDGALCLVAQDDRQGLWWLTAAEFIAHITSWVDNAVAGWPDDRPDLDLDRYFPEDPNDKGLYLYGSLDGPGGVVRFKPSKHDVWRTSDRARPPGRYRGKDRFGWHAHLNDVSVPPRSWAELERLLGKGLGLEPMIRARTITHLLVTYDRAGHRSAILLRAQPNRGTI